MILTVVCDACRRALDGEATTFQLNTGEIVATVDRGVSLRSTRSPAVANLCESCAHPLRELLAQLLSQGGRTPQPQP